MKVTIEVMKGAIVDFCCQGRMGIEMLERSLVIPQLMHVIMVTDGVNQADRATYIQKDKITR